jgi:anti-sigma regulatory factor (Ser/Thr protein kinase)
MTPPAHRTPIAPPGVGASAEGTVRRAVARGPAARRIVVALDSRSALDRGVARGAMTEAVTAGLFASSDLHKVEAALREAVSNAVVHGNLGLPGLAAFGGDPGAFYAAIESRLADPDRGVRPILLRWARAGRLIVLHVDDAGEGFAPIPAGAGAPGALSGRGMRIMRAFARTVRISRGGRRTSLGFRDGR